MNGMIGDRPARFRATLLALGSAAALAGPGQAQNPRERGAAQAVAPPMVDATVAATMSAPMAATDPVTATTDPAGAAPAAQPSSQDYPVCSSAVRDTCVQPGARPRAPH